MKKDHPCGLLEIKCPARAETISLLDLCTKAEYKPSAFFLQYKDGTYHLKKSHDYYHQVQGQLYINGRPWCDFVVWTPTFMSIERIWFDGVLWSKKMYPRLKAFYFCQSWQILDIQRSRYEKVSLFYGVHNSLVLLSRLL